MEYSHSDEQLLTQPIGYWSPAAGRAVVGYIRAELKQFGITQPQWWIVNQIRTGASGRTRAQLTDVLQGYMDQGADLGPEIDELVGQGLITLDDDRYQLTATGTALQLKCAEHQKTIRARIHHDVSDEEYLITIKVLQRMIHNVDGTAWHH